MVVEVVELYDAEGVPNESGCVVEVERVSGINDRLVVLFGGAPDPREEVV